MSEPKTIHQLQSQLSTTEAELAMWRSVAAHGGFDSIPVRLVAADGVIAKAMEYHEAHDMSNYCGLCAALDEYAATYAKTSPPADREVERLSEEGEAAKRSSAYWQQRATTAEIALANSREAPHEST